METIDGWALRPWRDSDADAFEAIVCDPGVGEFLGEIEGAVPIGHEVLYRIGDQGLYMRAAIIRADDPDNPVGLVMGGSFDTSIFDLSIGLVTGHRGRGAGRAVVQLVNRLVHDLEPDMRVSGVVRRENTACLRMLAGLGIATTDEDEEYFRA